MTGKGAIVSKKLPEDRDYLFITEYQRTVNKTYTVDHKEMYYYVYA